MTQAHEHGSQKKAVRARVVIVDDLALAREGMRRLLSGARHLEVAGEAANGRDAVALCRRLRPDLVLMDLRLPDIDGLAATRAIRQAVPQTVVLLMTMYEADYTSEVERAGGVGYVLKGASRREVLAAVRQALAARPARARRFRSLT